VDWVTGLVQHALETGCTRIEARADAEEAWVAEVERAHERMLFRRSRGWFTGYNSNVEGHQAGTVRYQAYFGGAPRYATAIDRVVADGYPSIDMT
jgi:hypothetical protein